MSIFYNEICDYWLIIHEIRNNDFLEEVTNQIDFKPIEVLYSMICEELSAEILPFHQFIGNIHSQLALLAKKELANLQSRGLQCLINVNNEVSDYQNIINRLRCIYYSINIFNEEDKKLFSMFYALLCNELLNELQPFHKLVEDTPIQIFSSINSGIASLKNDAFNYLPSINKNISDVNALILEIGRLQIFDQIQNDLFKIKYTQLNISGLIFNKSKEVFLQKKNINYNKLSSVKRDDSISQPLSGLIIGKREAFELYQADNVKTIIGYSANPKFELWDYYNLSNLKTVKYFPKEKNKTLYKDYPDYIKTENTNPDYGILINKENQVYNQGIETKANFPPLVLQNETKRNEQSSYLSIRNQKTRAMNLNISSNFIGLSFTCNSESASENIHFNIDKLHEEQSQLEKINLDLPDLNLCNVIDTILDAGNPNSDYLWSTGEKTQRIRVNKTGVYYVTVSRGNNNAVDSSYVRINSKPLINLPDYTIICQGDDICLNAGGGNYNYSWSTGATTTSIFVYEKGTYYVDVTNECGVIRDYSTVLISDSCNSISYKIPETFTPNGDGENESFIFNIKDMIYAKTSIFNLSGIKIYENQGVGKYWDGRIGEKKAPDGTYYYIIYAKKKTGDMEFRGRLRLKR
jgi:gliding motility-associated-like protein